MIELVVRIAFSLLVVLGLLWGIARISRRRVTGRGATTLTVLARQQLGRNSSVAVVRVVDRAIVLGVTDAQVSLLGEADLAALEKAAAPQERRDAVQVGAPARAAAPLGRLDGSVLSPKTWRALGDALRERTVRS
ncbi:hypothetical protein GCM10009682_23290 [Luedemannella flava]|uniref:Flagellar protein n=1 Tax=Luedemannella flava TaxID=349316 RepID=A0ABP4Y7Q3_9ACTN